MSKKVPGNLPPLPKTEIDGKVDLSKQTLPQLREIYERQTKLLSNKVFIQKLPDKGERIKTYCEKVLKQLNNKISEEQTCKLFDEMNINSISKESVENVEWEGRIKEINETYLDSDDDSGPDDVLGILTQAPNHKTKIVKKVNENVLITPTDLEEIKELSNELHLKYIVEKTEGNPNRKVERQYKPYKTTLNDSLDPSKEMKRNRGPKWEITAATPPPSIHGPVKQIPIEESLKLQKEQQEHLKQVLVEHAVERLFDKSSIKVGDVPLNLGDYREQDQMSSANEESDQSDDDRGGVSFTISS